MSYATVDQFKLWFSGSDGRRLDNYMQSVKDSSQDDLLSDALNVAAHEMDRVFESVGYDIPLDTSGIQDAAAKLRADKWLEKRNIDLAALELSIGVLTLPEALEEQAKRGLAALEGLRSDEKPHFSPRGRLEYLVAQGIPGLAIP
jgi:hypothetical protein